MVMQWANLTLTHPPPLGGGGVCRGTPTKLLFPSPARAGQGQGGGNSYRYSLNRSVACTSAARMPGSMALCPASGTTRYSASGQAR